MYENDMRLSNFKFFKYEQHSPDVCLMKDIDNSKEIKIRTICLNKRSYSYVFACLRSMKPENNPRGLC